MFEIAELGQKIDKKRYKREISDVRTDLLKLQHELKTADFPVIILISGVDGGGKGDMITLLNEWMDPRYIRTHAFGEPSDEERERPAYWRYWRALPSEGHIGILVGSWYSEPLAKCVRSKINVAELDSELNRINRFEKELVDDDALIIKCWLHLSKQEQKKRIKKLEKNPETRWRVTKRDKKHLKLYDKFIPIAERTLRRTNTDYAPWLIVDGSDSFYRSLTVGKHIQARISAHLKLNEENNLQCLPEQKTAPNNERALLNSLKLDQKLQKKIYKRDLASYQSQIAKLTRLAYHKKISTILVFEGWDAAGKGGAIRRITKVLDARHYRVIPIAAPTDEERSHHYLWRFWRHLPRDGNITIYDRSWYGRVLVERVEGLASPDEWFRAYKEITDFEEDLTGHGIVLIKYWLHISKDEQLKRFKKRENTSYKRYKISEEDYRNRERWEDYERAVDDMVTYTSTAHAPWHLIEGNDKRFARIKILKIFCEQLAEAVDNL